MYLTVRGKRQKRIMLIDVGSSVPPESPSINPETGRLSAACASKVAKVAESQNGRYTCPSIDVGEIIDDFAGWYAATFRDRLEDAESVAAALICYAYMLRMGDIPVKPAAKASGRTF